MHPDLKRRVRTALDRIRSTPKCGKALMGELAGWRSVRVGRLRIVYREAAAAVEVAAVGPRSTIYLEFARSLKRPR
jgi:plasmid stabilization system protein ParE